MLLHSSLPPLPLLPSSLDSTGAIHFLHLCTARRDPNLLSSLHAAISKSPHLRSDLSVANSLLDAYAKCGPLNNAENLFEQMPQRDVVTWTTLISAYNRNAAPARAVSAFLDSLQSENPNEYSVAALLKACAELGGENTARAVHGFVVTSGFIRDAFVRNSLINMYSKLGSMPSAERLLRLSSCRDVVSWSVVISGCVLRGEYGDALRLFVMMLEDGVLPNSVTVLSVLQACSLMNEPRNFGRVHGMILKLGLDIDALVVDSMIGMYSKSGLVGDALKIMLHSWGSNGIRSFDSDAMAALVHGCSVSGSFARGKEIHGFLVKHSFFPCTVIENSLVDMYSNCKEVTSARFVFRRMEHRDLVSWNTMMSCLSQNERGYEALEHLTQLHGGVGGDMMPDFITVLISIQACSKIASLQQGQILHGYSTRSGFDCDVFISNALIDMYSKSGRIDLAEKVFEEMDIKDIGSWNSMIQAYGTHGNGNSALSTFSKLKESREHTPNAITFTSIISACGHSGLIEEGYECFESMQRDYRIEPGMEHYASIVDLLARSGRLQEAETFIEAMPVEPGSAVWGSLLGACAMFGDVERAERAATQLSALEPDGAVWRVALSNVYALARRWEDVGKVRAEMKGESWQKDAGWSSVEILGRGSIKFMVGDTRHPETDRIYEVWNCIKEHIADGSQIEMVVSMEYLDFSD